MALRSCGRRVQVPSGYATGTTLVKAEGLATAREERPEGRIATGGTGMMNRGHYAGSIRETIPPRPVAPQCGCERSSQWTRFSGPDTDAECICRLASSPEALYGRCYSRRRICFPSCQRCRARWLPMVLTLCDVFHLSLITKALCEPPSPRGIALSLHLVIL